MNAQSHWRTLSKTGSDEGVRQHSTPNAPSGSGALLTDREKRCLIRNVVGLYQIDRLGRAVDWVNVYNRPYQ